MAEWLHCNRCSIVPNSNTKFFLTECGHIFCHRCVEKIKEMRKCCVCNKDTSVLALGKDVEPSILEFFTSLETSLKKIIEVSEFQTRHRNMQYQFLLKKYNYTKKEAIACNNANKRLSSNNKMLKSMLGAAGYNNQPFLTSTPMSQGGANPLFHNISRVSSIPSNMMSYGDQERTPRAYPGFPKRLPQSVFGSASTRSYGPSPGQMVPTMQRKPHQPAAVHGGKTGAMSLEELLRRDRMAPGGRN